MPFIRCIGRVLPKRIFLRDSYYNLWCVKVGKIGEDWYFQNGFRRFVRDNALKSCDFIVFDYFEKDMFDFKILGQDQCETVGSGGLVYYDTDGTDEDLDDASDYEKEENDEEEWDFGGDDDDGGGGNCCEDEYKLSTKQKFWSKGDDDNRIDGRLFVQQEPKLEQEDDDRVGIYEVHVKKEHKHERGAYGYEVRVKKEPKHGHDDVKKREQDDYCEVYVKKEHNHKRDDVKKQPKNERVDDREVGLDYTENHDNYNLCVEKKSHKVRDHECDEILDDYDTDVHDDIENHGNMIINSSSQILGDVDIEITNDVIFEKEFHYKKDVGVDVDNKEIEDLDCMLSDENEHDEHGQNQANKAKKHGGQIRKRASVFPRYYGMHIFESGLIPKPRNPYFITHVAPRRKGDLFIPTELIKDHHLEMPKPEMMLVDQQGRAFRGKYKKWKDGRILYSKGWRTLWKLNGVSLDDFCLCEFKRGKKYGLYLKVTIIHVNGGPPICMDDDNDEDNDDEV